MRPRNYKFGTFMVALKHSEGVMLPSKFSCALAESLTRLGPRDAKRALDLGCGSGLHAILLAKMGINDVLAVDSDRHAADAAEANALLNGVSEFQEASISNGLVSAAVGNMFDGLPKRCFDLIVSNPPTWPSKSDTPPYCNGGATGREFINKMIQDAPRFLRAGGRLIFVQSSLADVTESCRLLDEAGFNYDLTKVLEKIELRQFHLSHLRFYEELRQMGHADFDDSADGNLFYSGVLVDAKHSG